MSNYEIGYKKPPKHTQFKKGSTGNHRGRPKSKPKNFMMLINDELEKKITIKENGKLITVTKKEAIAKKLINQALIGDKKSCDALSKRMPAIEQELVKHTPTVTQDDMDSVLRSIVRSFRNAGIELTPEQSAALFENPKHILTGLKS